MARPFTDITRSISSNPIKNGTVIASATFRGTYALNNNYVKNTPVISDIAAKYGYRFYNGIFVQLVGDQTVIGG
jgi:hypothetical protein